MLANPNEEQERQSRSDGTGGFMDISMPPDSRGISTEAASFSHEADTMNKKQQRVNIVPHVDETDVQGTNNKRAAPVKPLFKNKMSSVIGERKLNPRYKVIAAAKQLTQQQRKKKLDEEISKQRSTVRNTLNRASITTIAAQARNQLNQVGLLEASEVKIDWVSRMVLSPTFDAIMGVVIAVNALVMAIEYETPEVELTAREYVTYRILDLLFLIAFTAEFALRIYVMGWAQVRASRVLMIDGAIVIVGWFAEQILPFVSGNNPYDSSLYIGTGNSSATGTLSLLKVVRIFRAIRVLRMLTMFQDLWYVLQLFIFSIRPLIWVMIFVLLVIFLFAMFSIALIGRPLEDTGGADPEYDAQLAKFQRTSRTISVLLQIMTLDTWSTVVNPLWFKYPLTYPFFIGYIALTGFALMNMITAVVLESARQRTQDSNFEFKVEQTMVEIAELFLISGDGSGTADTITKQEFINGWFESKVLIRFFEKLCLGVDDAGAFFDLLDKDRSGALSYEEVMSSYLELRVIIADAGKIAALRGARDQIERMLYLRRMLDCGSLSDTRIEDMKGYIKRLTVMNASIQGKLKEQENEIQLLRQDVSQLLGILGGNSNIKNRPIPLQITDLHGSEDEAAFRDIESNVS